jgi:hypothetical protein
MSDYLDNLVIKSRGLATEVEPRLTSLFEPPPSGQFNPAPFSLDQEEAHAEPAEPSLSVSSREASGDARLQRPDRVTARTADVSRPPMLIPPRPAAPAPIVAGDASGPAPPRAGGDRPVANERAGRRSTPGQELPPPTPARLAEQQGVGPQIESTARAAPIAPLITPAVTSAGGTRQPNAAAPMLIESAAPASPTTLLIAPMAVPARETRQPDSAAPTMPATKELAAEREQAPTIKITIGRVDVRAVMPAAPAPRPAPARRDPQLSLDDYLKRRSGEKP